MKSLTIVILILAAAAAAGCGNGQPQEGRRVGEAIFSEDSCCSSHLECQDGLYCTGIERCNCWGVCISGTPPDCNDGNSATVDRCINDTIGRPGVRGTDGNPGVDGDLGTGHCEYELVGRPCTTAADCYDDDACTTDRCVANFCVYDPVNCDDGDVCTADSCDIVSGCTHNALQLCCTTDADCNDGSACTGDACNTTTHVCEHTANAGVACTFGNECFEPGTCGADGLCHPGPQVVPPNDTCAGAAGITLDASGEGSAAGSTLCARHDSAGSCAAGMNADVVYSFAYSGGLGAEISQVGTDHTVHQNDSCHNVNGTAVESCVTNWWEFVFNFPAAGGYRTGIETSNYNGDLSALGIKHRVRVYLDGVDKGEIVNAATNPQHQTGTLYLGNVTAGAHTLRYYWINDWYSAPFDSNIRLYRVWIQADGAPYQLYAYNCVLDGDFDTVLYARRTCADAASELACNNNCVTSALLDCGFYGLGTTDSAFTLPPYPTGAAPSVWLIVDGRGGEKGNFTLDIHRIAHRNNPCATLQDNVQRVDATGGGEFRGNVNGYINDMLDAGLNWLKTPCHDAAAAGSDWPANAWFVLRPAADTVYRVWTDEVTPAAWFDTVIGVWENSSALGCGGQKNYRGCAHLAGRNGPDSPTQYQFTATGGRIYLVGVSAFARPTAGDYIVHFDMM
jgi:hypothetical protein